MMHISKSKVCITGIIVSVIVWGYNVRAHQAYFLNCQIRILTNLHASALETLQYNTVIYKLKYFISVPLKYFNLPIFDIGESYELWCYQYFELLKENYKKPPFPPPLNLVYIPLFYLITFPCRSPLNLSAHRFRAHIHCFCSLYALFYRR